MGNSFPSVIDLLRSVECVIREEFQKFMLTTPKKHTYEGLTSTDWSLKMTFCPSGQERSDNVASTSLQFQADALTMIRRRCVNVMCPLGCYPCHA